MSIRTFTDPLGRERHGIDGDNIVCLQSGHTEFREAVIAVHQSKRYNK